MPFEADTHELHQFADELHNLDIRPELAKVTGRAMNNIKKDVRRTWKGMKHLPRLPYAITYDVWTFGAKITGEVGADHKRRQGKLAWVAEYGTPTSAPHPAFRPAAEKERPDWERFLEKVAADAAERGIDYARSEVQFTQDADGRIRDANGRFVRRGAT